MAGTVAVGGDLVEAMPASAADPLWCAWRGRRDELQRSRPLGLSGHLYRLVFTPSSLIPFKIVRTTG